MIRVQNLAKRFEVASPKKLSEQEKKDPRLIGRYFHSVRDVSFHCNKGEVLGLLGPNGAGKTTTLRVLSTALKADRGDIFISDQSMGKKPLEVRKKIGFLSGTTGLYGRLSGRENIEYFGRLHGVSTDVIESRIVKMSALLNMETFLERRAETYSTGMKQKVAIARAVIHEPEVVVLDEPTTGLDIMATATVLDFIATLKEKRVPVIFSTHHLGEVEALCDRVAVINHGVSTFDDSLDAFKALSGGNIHQCFMEALNMNKEQGQSRCG